MSEDLDSVWAERERETTAKEIESAVRDSADDEVVCRECAVAFGQVTEQHTTLHGMALAEYKEKYPDAPVYPVDGSKQPGREPGFECSLETREKISRSMRETEGWR